MDDDVEVVTHTYEDPRLCASLFALFDTVWGFLRPKEALAGALGFPWRQISTPFTAVRAGEVVAHAGLLGLPLRVDGRDVEVGAIHAVCVREALRGQGLGRRVLSAAIAAAERRYAGQVLASEKVGLYAKFGFSPRALRVFVADGVRGTGRARALDLRRAEDAAIWVEAMRTRVPLSDRFAVVDRGAVNAFDAVNRDGTHAPLWHDEAVGAVYYARLAEGRAVIDDVFAPRVFDGAELLAGLPFACSEVIFGFDPLGLGVATRAREVAYAEKDDRLMIRGGVVEGAVAWPAYSFT